MRYAKYLAVAAGVAGCNGAEADSADAAGFGEGGPPPTPVDVAVARQDTVIDRIFATGQIEALQSIELRPEVSGRLTEILVREGAEVRRGTPLFKIDDSESRAQVARLEAERDLARQALERTRDLIARNASSQADLEQAEASSRSAEAQLELQQIRLDRTVVRAPFGGVMGRRFVSLGDYVDNGTRLTSLQTVNPQRVAFAVPERYAQRLANGQEVVFRVAAVAGREYTGTVEFVDPVVELPARTITVKARVGNRDRTLKTGMFVEIRLATDVRPNAVVVPEDAILPLQGLDFVWAVVDGTAQRRQVQLGVRTPGFVEILSGVEAGEQVVVGGLERLFDGAPVIPNLVQRTADDIQAPAN